MNKKIDFSQPGGLYTYQDTLDFLQTAYGQSIDAIASAVGDKVILSGVVDQGAQTSAGWIAYNGEVLPFVGGLKATYVIIENIPDSEQFDDAQQRSVYSTRRAKFGNAIGTLGGFLFSELKPFPFKSTSINAALSAVQTVLKSIVNFESAVILDGCTVSSVVGSNMQVSVGTLMFSGNLIVTPAYNGAFPAYISELGVWSTGVPGAGLYIKFDPYTSQRYKDVLRRFNHQTGDILMSKVVSDRFDPATGIGKWEWLGFKLSADLQGRVGVGYWFGNNGPTNVYDAGYRVIGYYNGENTHLLTNPEMPLHVHTSGIRSNSQDYVDGGAAPNNIGLNSPVGSAAINTGSAGGNVAHENRQPFLVIAYIERI